MIVPLLSIIVIKKLLLATFQPMRYDNRRMSKMRSNRIIIIRVRRGTKDICQYELNRP